MGKTNFDGFQSSEKIDKIINYIMKSGKKSVAKKIFADVLKDIKSNGHMNPVVVVETAIENASPSVMIKSKRIGGSIYQVPVEVKQNKRLFYSVRWILDSARTKKGKPMYKKLSEEILAAYSSQGAAVKKKEETHKMAEANKAFAYMAKYIS
ncbi:30S ribosomal protein S7 [Candidatus Gracilibacteria bacterium]|nr:30S ribosomal protein S7 [Candidatus Gracilibacteria bacterium]